MKILVLLLVLMSVFPPGASSFFDPLSRPNNKYGIHIIDENDLDSASHLVNSSGGDWGYVTMVITEEDRKPEKWTKIFEKMGEYHLIPIIRLATRLTADYWEKPGLEEAGNWADFLDSLPWPVNNRYIIIYNEPNHAKEWGNAIEPENYADILVSFSSELKSRSEDFFILPAGLDASAPDSRITMDEARFLRMMVAYNPGIFDYIDGWTSHSYPNPGFSGRVTARGRGTLGTFIWELDFLKSLEVGKPLPVFITETGWAHNQDTGLSNYLSTDAVSYNYVEAGNNIWSRHEIVVVSPFLLNYQGFPFNNFSWQKMNSREFYPQFDAYRSILKVKGEPVLPSPTPTPEVYYAKDLVKGDSTKISEIGKVSLLDSLLAFIRRLLI